MNQSLERGIDRPRAGGCLETPVRLTTDVAGPSSALKIIKGHGGGARFGFKWELCDQAV